MLIKREEFCPDNLTCVHCGKHNIPSNADSWTCDECVAAGHSKGGFLDCPVCLKQFADIWKSGDKKEQK